MREYLHEGVLSMIVALRLKFLFWRCAETPDTRINFNKLSLEQKHQCIEIINKRPDIKPSEVESLDLPFDAKMCLKYAVVRYKELVNP